ncbi:MAG TPA: dihydrofolate reductase family protein [Acidimicrobiales bacterium]|jgi:dihydrofolate reductase
MGRIVISEFVSLDGVMEDPGGSESYVHGGWTFTFDRGTEGDRFKMQEVLDSDALLLGRTTYEGFAQAWPSMEGEFADLFNSLPKYVVSSTMKEASWQNTTIVDGATDPMAEVRRLRDAHARDLVVHGSTTLAQSLIAAGLVDELRLMVFPVVLGSGRRLFGELSDPARFTLASCNPLGPDGIVLAVYRPAPAKADSV